MDSLGAVDQFYYKADQYGVASSILGGAVNTGSRTRW